LTKIQISLSFCACVVGNGGPSSSKHVSFKDVAKKKPSTLTTTNPPFFSVYIVEKYEEVPKLDVFELNVTKSL
jgi:hypothetical protein